MEAEVFAEIKNVEKLLTLLSTSNTAPREEDNEEISVRRETVPCSRGMLTDARNFTTRHLRFGLS